MKTKTTLILTAVTVGLVIAAGAGIAVYQAASTALWRLQHSPASGAIVTTILALALAAVAGWLVVEIKDNLHRRKVERAARELETVKFYSDQHQTWAVNPLGLILDNLSHDWRLTIDPGQPEPMPDQWQVIRSIEFIRNKQPGRAIKTVDLPMLPEPAIQPVLPLILPSQRVLVAGGQGSGKTNLLRWIAYEKAKLSKVLVIDTHSGPGYWPIDQASVLGRGRNWGAVEQALIRLLEVMDQRYKDIDAGLVDIRGHEIITMVADEWTMIPEMIGEKVIKQYTKPVLTESRKAAIDFVLAAHDTTVEALGIKGMGGLLKTFDWLIETECQNGQYICKVRKPKQKPSEAVIYAAPPLFNMPSQPARIGAGSEPELSFTVAPEPVEVETIVSKPSPEDEAVMVAYFTVLEENGGAVVWSKVCEKLGKTKGGKQVDQIKAILARWGVNYE